jgi:hypothetical protein
MRTDDIWYKVGSGVAFVTPGRILLIADEMNTSTSDRLWDSIQTGRTFHDLVDALVTVGLRNIDSFGVVFVDEDVTHVLLRGRVSTAVHTAEQREVVTATGAITWIERSFEQPDAVELSVGREDQRNIYPFGSGVVHAEWLRVGTPVEAPATSSVRFEAPRDIDRYENVTPQASVSADLTEATDPAAWTFRTESDEEVQQTLHPFESRSGRDEKNTVLPASLAHPGAMSSTDDEGDEFDALFGSTQFRAVETAAVRTDETSPEVASNPSVPPTPPAPSHSNDNHEPLFFSGTPSPRLARPPSQPPPPGSGPLIEGVPGVGGSPAAFQIDQPALDQSSSSAPPDEQGESFTISRAQLLKMKQTPQASNQAAPEVHGILCNQGHPNPPHATLCRVCHARLSAVDPITMPRPVLGTLRFSNGTEALLDRPMIIGRSPRAERVSGRELPQLVSLPSPDQNISRNHLEIRIDGWHVIVVDLESVNGTVVTNPSQAPELLRAGEEAPIVPGSMVSIADEITFVYEVTE